MTMPLSISGSTDFTGQFKSTADFGDVNRAGTIFDFTGGQTGPRDSGDLMVDPKMLFLFIGVGVVGVFLLKK